MQTRPVRICLKLATLLCLLLAASPSHAGKTKRVKNVSELMKAVNQGSNGDTIEIAAGTYWLKEPLRPKDKMTIRGAGRSKTYLKASSSWKPGTGGLPDQTEEPGSVKKNAYMFSLSWETTDVTITQVNLDGRGRLHGAIHGDNPDRLEVTNALIDDFVWSGIRTFRLDHGNFHDINFIDAGGKHGNTTGGALFMTWTTFTEVSDCKFSASSSYPRKEFYGIKGHQTEHGLYHHNTFLNPGFSVEFPHANDHNNELSYNYLKRTVSLPKDGGGSVARSGVNWRIHHNVFKQSYSLEWSRNAVEVDHNLFDFSTNEDGGHVITSWSPKSKGPTRFHDNLIKNPGRGLIVTTSAYNNFSFYNNHVIANKTKTPRGDGLFGFHQDTDFSTISIKNNIIECIGKNRKLMRHSKAYKATIENNTLKGISDTGQYKNRKTSNRRGPRSALKFKCGRHDEYSVDRWSVKHTG